MSKVNTPLKTSTFHPKEIAICGFSGSGKTTLLEKLIRHLSSYELAIIKHDGHQFEMDTIGKDTFRFREAGAKSVLINNHEKFCLQTQDELNTFTIKQTLIDYDFVLVEGHKESKLPKLIMVDENLKILEFIKNNDIQNIEGFIIPHQELSKKLLNFNLPVFQRDDIDSIANHIIKKFKQPAPLKALILAGGKSTRMGEDKGHLKYFGTHQTHYLFDKLKNVVDDVYVSVRSEQCQHEHVKDLPQIVDQFPSAGPMAGILSAQHFDPTAAWLVVAVDLPYLDDDTLKELISKRNPLKIATAFKNPVKGWPEPLCTIWEPKSKLKLHQYWGMDRICPRKVLFNSKIKLLNLNNLKALDNCNTQKDYQTALSLLSKGENHATN